MHCVENNFLFDIHILVHLFGPSFSFKIGLAGLYNFIYNLYFKLFIPFEFIPDGRVDVPQPSSHYRI